MTQLSISSSEEDSQEEQLLSATDVQAEQEAAEARQKGTELIRNHLRRHLEQNPDSSYVTWIATLHPENAEVSIDPRFFVQNNAWQTVFEEVKLGGREVPHVVELTDETGATGKTLPPCFGLIDGLVGYSLLIASVLTTLLIELVIMVFSILTHAVHFVMSVTNPFRLTCSSGGGVLVQILVFPLFVTSLVCFIAFDLVLIILTLVSSLLVELLSGIAFLLTALFTLSVRVAYAWHQFLRKVTHHVRWACRSTMEDAFCCKERTAAKVSDDSIVRRVLVHWT